MARYTLGNAYDVQLTTVHAHHLTWAKFKKAIADAGPRGADESDLRDICRADKNPGYFSYCVKRGWLRTTP